MFYGIDDLARLFAIDNLQRQSADGEYLIGPQRCIEVSRLVIGVDDIVQMIALSVPKMAAETVEAARERFLPGVIELAADP